MNTNTLNSRKRSEPPLPAPLPEWTDVPGASRIVPIGRSSLYEVISNGEVRSVVVRKPGNVRGRRMINVRSLLDYIESFEETPAS